MPTNPLQPYAGVLTNLGFDLVAILLMTYVLYFRRHWRADLLLAYVALNIGIFVTMSVLSQVKVDVAVGFGLFAILSMIRLRSSAVTQQEVAYYFLALVIGLINGIGVPDHWLLLGLNVVPLLIMYLFDRRALRDRSWRLDVKLDGIYTNQRALVDELERKLGCKVMYHEITEINISSHHMTVDVRLRPGDGVVELPPEKHHAHDANGATPTAAGAAPEAAPMPTPEPRHDGVARHGV